MAGPFPGKGFFDAVYQGRAPWDIGAPQPDLMAVLEAWPPGGRVLDLGCGTGDLAIALAARGHEVTGLEFAPAALDVARERAAALPEEARARLDWVEGDALAVSEWRGRIHDVVDSGFYHLFEADERARLVDGLAAALPEGGRYFMLGFAIAIPAPDVPRQVTEDELRALFSDARGWRIRALQPARFQTVGFDAIPAVVLCAERVGAGG